MQHNIIRDFAGYFKRLDARTSKLQSCCREQDQNDSIVLRGIIETARL